MTKKLPIIGITTDNRDNTATSGRYESASTYSHQITLAGGIAMLLPHEPQRIDAYVATLDAVIFTGGVDPDTRPFGKPLHAQARLIDPQRQAFELALLNKLKQTAPDKPVLGVCLGMQMMALHAGGSLCQYLPDVLAEPQIHENDNHHRVCFLDNTPLPMLAGITSVCSHHRQAVADSGNMRVVATAPDGVIEAIDCPKRAWYLGVQWHPERGEVTPSFWQHFVQTAQQPLG